MRAYLSDIHNAQGSDPNAPKYGFLDDGATSVGDFLSGVAEREARAILSESEAGEHRDYYAGPSGLRLCATLPDINTGLRDPHAISARFALAESLAAFVGE